jgi:pilus assembly protein Flp/PilA
MKHIFKRGLGRFAVNDAGATAVEYGLIVALIAAVCVGGMTMLGGSSGGSWDGMANKAGNAMNQ